METLKSNVPLSLSFFGHAVFFVSIDRELHMLHLSHLSHLTSTNSGVFRLLYKANRFNQVGRREMLGENEKGELGIEKLFD